MLYLSEILLKHHELETFEALLEIIREKARTSGELFLKIDIRPPYPDTPADWEDKVEGAFVGVHSVTDS